MDSEYPLCRPPPSKKLTAYRKQHDDDSAPCFSSALLTSRRPNHLSVPYRNRHPYRCPMPSSAIGASRSLGSLRTNRHPPAHLKLDCSQNGIEQPRDT